ncbi:FadR/GntR family transcriptional regulator [Cellulosimicrobium sp. PMB13]|uniref:FadR/GntR family transcriptional regulator n=1 Tax=Cellulosimicrobium sp. PMB13 TaxID=3120158 RepID=UPI003F4C2E03
MSRTDEVVDGIKRMILDGTLGPGDRLPVEKDLAESLGVSRGSLREGVRALSILGVVDTRQGDGTYVTSLDPQRLLAPMGFVVDLQGESSALSFHAVRRVLETEAAALAAARITPGALAEARRVLDGVDDVLAATPVDHERFIEADIAFHRVVAEQAGNPVLAALVESLASRTVRERLWRGLHEDGAEQRTHDEHEAIWRALADRDPERARIRMANHLLGVEESLRGGTAIGDVPDGDA